MHAVMWLKADSVIYDHCTATVKKKNGSTSTAAICRATFMCPAGPGQAGF